MKHLCDAESVVPSFRYAAALTGHPQNLLSGLNPAINRCHAFWHWYISLLTVQGFAAYQDAGVTRSNNNPGDNRNLKGVSDVHEGCT